MRHIPTVVGIVLGLFFAVLGVLFLAHVLPSPPPAPDGSWPALFMGSMIPSGYMNAVKVCEVIGGILIAIPLTRNLGLLVLGPIILNIIAFHLFIMKGETLMDPILGVIVAATLFLLWVERKAFAGLIWRRS